jgi:hypothetical protein
MNPCLLFLFNFLISITAIYRRDLASYYTSKHPDYTIRAVLSSSFELNLDFLTILNLTDKIGVRKNTLLSNSKVALNNKVMHCAWFKQLDIHRSNFQFFEEV